MSRFRWKRLFRGDEKSVEKTFRKEEPLHENVNTGFLSRAKRTVGGAMLGLTLATGMVADVGCSGNKQDISEQDASEERDVGNHDGTGTSVVVNKAALTDEEGKAIFDVNGATYELNVNDFESGERISNLLVFLSLKNDWGIYIIIDQENRYHPKIVGISSLEDSEEGIGGGGPETRVTNVVEEKSGDICNALTWQITQGISPEELYRDRHLDDEEESIIQQKFDLKKDDVPLSELNDVFKQLLEISLSEVAERGIAATAVKAATVLGVKVGKTGGQIGTGVGLVLTAVDICAAIDTLVWGTYYRSLCYEENDKFEIWKLKGPTQDIDIPIPLTDLEVNLLTNPVFVILPKEKEDPNWEVPVGHIDGKIKLTEDIPGFPGYMRVYLEHIDGRIPQITYIPLYDFITHESEFYFTASTCENYNPTYNLGIHATPLYGNPTTTIEFNKQENGDEKETYDITFYLSKDCEESYRTFYRDSDGDGLGDKYNLVVSCTEMDGYIENGNDCDDENIGERCPGCYTLSSFRVTSTLDIYGDIVVFYGDGIHYANIQSGEINSMPSTEECSVGGINPHIWEDKIVTSCYGTACDGICLYKIGEENIEMIDEGGNSSIQGNKIGYIGQSWISESDYLWTFKTYNLTTTEIQEAVLPENFDAYSFIPTLIHGSRITALLKHNEGGGWKTDLCLYDFNTGELRIIDAYAENNGETWAIYGDKIVFGSWTGFHVSDVFVYDIPSGSIRLLTDDFSFAEQPDLWENKMVLYGANEGKTGLFVMDITSGVINNIIEEGSESMYSPGIYNNTVVYFGSTDASISLTACILDDD